VRTRGDFDPLAWSAVATLHARAVEQDHPEPLLLDPPAARWWRDLAVDPKALPLGRATRVAVCARAVQFDRWAEAWLMANPAGVVVELGVGFGTRAERLGLEPEQTVGVDRAAVMARRRALGEGSPGISGDVTNPQITDQLVELVRGRPVCLIAEGLLMYLGPPEVQRLVRRLADRFPGATLLFDGYAPAAPFFTWWHDSLPRLGLKLRSTRPRSAPLRMEETRSLRDLPGASARLPFLYRLPGVHRLYGMYRATLG
jgi:O-methyltransferase involved in polyketide biosynthesis